MASLIQAEDLVLIHERALSGAAEPIRLFIKKEDMRIAVYSVEKESEKDNVPERTAACTEYMQRTPPPQYFPRAAQANDTMWSPPDEQTKKYTTYVAIYFSHMYFKVCVDAEEEPVRLLRTKSNHHITSVLRPISRATCAQPMPRKGDDSQNRRPTRRRHPRPEVPAQLRHGGLGGPSDLRHVRDGLRRRRTEQHLPADLPASGGRAGDVGRLRAGCERARSSQG